MELDDLKAKTREIEAPAGLDRGAEESGVDGLLRAIKAADERAAGQARTARPLYAVAAAAFLAGSALSLASAGPAAGPRTLHFGVIGSVMLLLALLLHRKARSVRRTDYSRPVNAFLAEAERRYRFMRPGDLAYSIPLLLVLALSGWRVVLAEMVPRYVVEDDAAVVACAYIFFFAAVCGFGYYFTYKNWKKEHGAIWAEMRRIRQEME